MKLPETPDHDEGELGVGGAEELVDDRGLARGPHRVVRDGADVVRPVRDVGGEVEGSRGRDEHAVARPQLVPWVPEWWQAVCRPRVVERRQPRAPCRLRHRVEGAVAKPARGTTGGPEPQTERRHPVRRHDVDGWPHSHGRHPERLRGDHWSEDRGVDEHHVSRAAFELLGRLLGVEGGRPRDESIHEATEELDRVAHDLPVLDDLVLDSPRAPVRGITPRHELRSAALCLRRDRGVTEHGDGVATRRQAPRDAEVDRDGAGAVPRGEQVVHDCSLRPQVEASAPSMRMRMTSVVTRREWPRSRRRRRQVPTSVAA